MPRITFFSLHAIELERISVEQNELVRAMIDVNLFRSNFRHLKKVRLCFLK